MIRRISGGVISKKGSKTRCYHASVMQLLGRLGEGNWDLGWSGMHNDLQKIKMTDTGPLRGDLAPNRK